MTNVIVENEEPSPIQRRLRIEVDAVTVDGAFQTVVKQIGQHARIDGFRKGKVPRGLLRRRFAREIEDDVSSTLVPSAVRDALGQTGLQPLHEPVITDVELAEGSPFRFTAAFEIAPTIEPKNYRGVVITAHQAEVTDEDVTRQIDSLREANAQYESLEPRPVEDGDHVLVDLRNDAHGEEQTQEGVMIEVGSDQFHPDFSRNVTGLEAGAEIEFKVTYGDDDPDPEARGRSVNYFVRVRELKRKVLPERDDEFARDLGEFDSIAALEARVRRDLEAQLERQTRRAQENQAAQALLEGLEIELPNALVERELDRAVEEQARVLAMRGIDPRTAPVDWRATREKMREQAERSVKWELLLLAIAREEEIHAGDDEIEERIRRIADGADKSPAFIRSKIEKDGQMEELRRSIILERSVDFVLRNAKMEVR